MNTLIIDKTKNIDIKILEKISINSQWQGLKNQLLLENSTDLWVNFVKESYSSILLNNKGELISFGAFGMNKDFGEEIIKSLGLDVKKSLIGIYLYTRNEFKGNGYARAIKDEQIKFINQNFPDIKYLIGSTSEKGIFELYKKYGAIKINLLNKENKILINEGIVNNYFYYYKT